MKKISVNTSKKGEAADTAKIQFRMKKYVFFDLDGTLTDPVEGITNSVRYALDHFGITENDPEKLKRFIGPPLIGAFMEYYGLTESQADTALKQFRVYFEKKGITENKLYPGTKKALSDLKEAGFVLVVASSKPERYVRQILKNFEIYEFFDFIGGSDMEETRADKPSVIRYCLENLGDPPPRDCVMVGDRLHDVLGARENSIDCIGVLFGCGSREELESAGARVLAVDMEDLKEKIIFYFINER